MLLTHALERALFAFVDPWVIMQLGIGDLWGVRSFLKRGSMICAMYRSLGHHEEGICLLPDFLRRFFFETFNYYGGPQLTGPMVYIKTYMSTIFSNKIWSC